VVLEDIDTITHIKGTLLISVDLVTVLAFCYLVTKIQKLKNKYVKEEFLVQQNEDLFKAKTNKLEH
jgi:hypothetical protein